MEEYDKLARAAIGQGVTMDALNKIPVKEKIGRAKMIAPDKYEAEYAAIIAGIKEEIDAVIAGGEDA